ncbi:MAG: hypothetical protein OXC06_05285 [Acidimicrobiaceae bacterium]|nr:hypothetical protein [Acidimicrobiaceae bacterium]
MAAFEHLELLADPCPLLLEHCGVVLDVVGCLLGEPCRIAAQVVEHLVAEPPAVAQHMARFAVS